MKELLRTSLLKILESRGTRYMPFWRSAERTCPPCGFVGTFHPFGLYYVRPDAECPSCGSLERHRQLKLAFDEGSVLLSDKMDVLHFAPEKSVGDLIRARVGSYTTADLFSENVDKRWNIEEIDCDDGAFDLVICSHVLEHVDTRKALRELYRVLRPGGLAILMVPICEGLDQTYEDDSITTDQGRWIHFQQTDHTRIFGRDFRDMVREAGFDLSESVAQGAAAVRYGLVMGERIFFARKPA